MHLMLAKKEDKRRRGQKRMRWLDSATDSRGMNLSTLWDIAKDRKAFHQIANICWIIEKAREFQRNIYFCFIDYAKAFAGISLLSLPPWV